MKLLKFTSKDKNDNRCVRFSYIRGIPGLFTIPQEVVDVTIDKEQGQLFIQSALHKNKSASLALDKITDVRSIKTIETFYKQKNIIGRALAGGVLGTHTGMVLGTLSGIGKKKKNRLHHCIVISYHSDNITKKILLEVVGASIGWRDFVAELPKDPNSIYAPKPQKNHIKL